MKGFNFSGIGIVLLLAVITSATYDIYYWSWPSLDMASYFFQKHECISCLVNDNFTQSFSPENGRIFYATIIDGLISLFGSWTITFHWLIQIMNILLPFSWALGLLSITDTLRNDKLVFWTCFYMLTSKFMSFFMVAWWTAWKPMIHPSVMAVIVINIGVYFHSELKTRGILRYVVLLLTIYIALKLHPSFALGMLTIYSLIILRLGIREFISFVLPAFLALVIVFVQTRGLVTESFEFYKTYFINLHPEHYVFEGFVGLYGFNWLFSVLLYVALVCLAFVLNQKNRLSIILIGLFGLSSIALQYFVVESDIAGLLPLLLIGPVRWYSVTILPLVFFAFQSVDISRFQISLPRRLKIVLFFVGFLTFGFYLFVSYKGPSEIDPELYEVSEFLSKTQQDPVVIAPPKESSVFPLFHGVSVFVGNGFPFSEKFIAENYKRYVKLYGDPVDSLFRRNSRDYFHNNIVDISRENRELFVIAQRENLHQEISREYLVFENKKYLMYYVEK